MQEQLPIPISDFFSPATTFPTVSSFLTVLLRNVMIGAGIIAFIAIVYAGLSLIRAAGAAEGEATEKNKQAITAAIIGLVLIVAAYWIVQILESITGVSIFKGGL